jgi:hypothetical protein
MPLPPTAPRRRRPTCPTPSPSRTLDDRGHSSRPLDHPIAASSRACRCHPRHAPPAPRRRRRGHSTTGGTAWRSGACQGTRRHRPAIVAPLDIPVTAAAATQDTLAPPPLTLGALVPGETPTAPRRSACLPPRHLLVTLGSVCPPHPSRLSASVTTALTPTPTRSWGWGPHQGGAVSPLPPQHRCCLAGHADSPTAWHMSTPPRHLVS